MGNPKFHRDPKALLAAKRKKLIALARTIPDRDRRVLPLAQAFNVSAPTVRKWLDGAGLTHAARRGRPLAGEYVGFQDIRTLLAAAAHQGQAVLEHASAVQSEEDE